MAAAEVIESAAIQNKGRADVNADSDPLLLFTSQMEAKFHQSKQNKKMENNASAPQIGCQRMLERQKCYRFCLSAVFVCAKCIIAVIRPF